MARSALGWCWLIAALAGLLPGATTIGGPIAGYVAESSGPVLRAILGVPGSFRFSDPLTLPDGVTRVYVAPGQNFALVERTDSGLAVLSLSGGTADRLTAIDGATPAADWVAFSPQARSAILFSASASRLQVLSGLPGTPRVAMDLDTNTLPGPPRTGAVSDDAQTLLIAAGRGVYLLPASGGAPQLLLPAIEAVSLALFRNGVDAAVWDGGTGSIHLMQNVSTAPAARVLTSGLKGPGKLYPSWDGESLFVVQPGAKGVSSINLASGEIQSFDTGAKPVTLEALRNHDTFLISARRHQPAWIFYLDGTAGHVVFVPAAKPMTESRQ